VYPSPDNPDSEAPVLGFPSKVYTGKKVPTYGVWNVPIIIRDSRGTEKQMTLPCIAVDRDPRKEKDLLSYYPLQQLMTTELPSHHGRNNGDSISRKQTLKS
jgi:hypothetical protein